MIERILWGVKQGDPDWQEVVLSRRKEKFDMVIRIATRDGYHKFRVAVLDMSIPPDFKGVVRS